MAEIRKMVISNKVKPVNGKRLREIVTLYPEGKKKNGKPKWSSITTHESY